MLKDGLLYRCASDEFALFESAGAPSAGSTRIGWDVADIEAMVAELKARGGLHGARAGQPTVSSPS